MTKQKTTHRMGKVTGYELQNGEYHIAPTYVEQFDKLLATAQGIRMMLDVVTEHATKDFEALTVAHKALWDALRDDLGVAFDKGLWAYSNGVISEVPKPAEQPEK